MSTIDSFVRLVGGILTLDQDAIRAVQTAPNGISFALSILLLACVSDVVGDSPLLFMRRMRPVRLVISMLVQGLLAAVRLAAWMLCFWLIASVLERAAVPLPRVVLVIGIGYAPMLLGALVLIPTLGPFLGRVLIAWTLVAVTTSIAVARDLDFGEALATSVVAALAVLLVRRTGDRVVLALLSAASRRLLGVDVMQQTRVIDPARLPAFRPLAPPRPDLA